MGLTLVSSRVQHKPAAEDVTVNCTLSSKVTDHADARACLLDVGRTASKRPNATSDGGCRRRERFARLILSWRSAVCS
jgi:hypothetical protein